MIDDDAGWEDFFCDCPACRAIDDVFRMIDDDAVRGGDTMTHEQMQELTELRQYKRDTDIYVQKMEDNHAYYMTLIRNQAQEIEQLRFAVNRLQDAAMAKVKAVYEYKVEHGILDRLDVVNQWD